jgi:D-glycero-alpha-D-manno-heptose-7-phosphate kinase
MIITKAPYRISFAGGGTDFKEYYEKDFGSTLSTTIDKFVYIVLKKSFENNIILHYSKGEVVNSAEEIRHPLLRESLLYLGIKNGVEIASIADIPGGTGLGSSGAYTVALLKALHTFKEDTITPEQIAEEAIDIELNKLDSPIGKQDQYAAATGGLNYYKFAKDGKVSPTKIDISINERNVFNANLLLLFTGMKRDSSSVLSEQKKKTEINIPSLDKLRNQAKELKSILETKGVCDDIGELFDAGWQEKKKLSSNISNNEIDDLYKKGISAGAIGGRVIGAGGGGFLLFYCPVEKQKDVIEKTGLRPVGFDFSNHGVSVIFNN